MKKFFSNKGVALLMVLWVLMLLTVIVGEFCFAMRTRVNITRNFKESTEAYYIAVAGLNKAIEQTILQQMTPPRRIVSIEEGDEEAADTAAVDWRINADMPPVAFGSGEYEIRIENESGKINLNMADRELLRVMLAGFDIDEEEKDVIADSILDWRDTDRNHLINGAEDDYYQSLPEPYECKDGDFDSKEELLRVRGVTPEIYEQGLAGLVTVFPKSDAQKRKQRASKKEFDYNRLNINAIPLELWANFPGMTDALAAAIAAYRAEKDFESLRDISDIVGPEVYRGMAKYLTTQTSPYFIIRSTGKIPGSRIAEGLTAVILFDMRAKRKYQVIQWTDDIDHRQPGSRLPVS